MPASYIPAKDADYADWLDNFATLIAAAPTDYGLVAGDGTAIDASRDAFLAAYALAVNPSTRTTPTVAAKDAARASSQALARSLAVQVQAWPSITPELLGDLGLTVRDLTPTPIPAPTTTPLLSVVGGTNLAQTVRYSDELTPAARKKPFGAIALQLYRHVGTTPPAGPEDASFYGSFTKNPVLSEFDSGDAGKTCTYFGRWQTRRGLVGPWSMATSMTVAASV
jgi:hypothetical protein